MRKELAQESTTEAMRGAYLRTLQQKPIPWWEYRLSQIAGHLLAFLGRCAYRRGDIREYEAMIAALRAGNTE